MDKKVRAPHLWEIIVALLLLVVVLSIAIGVLNVDTYGPFILVIAFTSVMAMRMGLGWKEIQQAILSSLQSVLQALLILIMVGMVISTWIQGGIVPSLIYYGLRMIHPNIFLVTIFLVCSICAVATGSSWTIIGTLGIAAIGISQGIGIPVYITAGIVVSAAYFGDKLSPLSDTPNLHFAIVGVNLFENFKNVLRNTLPSYFIALILCVVVGFCYQTENGGSLSEIQLMTETLAENFVISPWLILPVLSVFCSDFIENTCNTRNIIYGIYRCILRHFCPRGNNCGSYENGLQRFCWKYRGRNGKFIVKSWRHIIHDANGFVDFLRSILWWCFGSIRYIAILLGKNDAFCQKG